MRPATQSLSPGDAAALIASVGPRVTCCLLGPPGHGKSAVGPLVAAELQLPYVEIAAASVAPEDFLGPLTLVDSPHGPESTWAPPRDLIPRERAVIAIDEITNADTGTLRALHPVLLHGRIGARAIAPGTILIATGNRPEDHPLARTLPSAIVNRMLMLEVRTEVKSWVRWALDHGLREDVVAFVTHRPEALARPVADDNIPFSSPRAWTQLSRALDALDGPGVPVHRRRATIEGLVSPVDAAVFASLLDEAFDFQIPAWKYLAGTEPLPAGDASLWQALHAIRVAVTDNTVEGVSPRRVRTFLSKLHADIRNALLVGLAPAWAQLGAGDAILDLLDGARA